METLSQLLDEVVERHARKTAVWSDGRRVTYGSLRQTVRSLAVHLRSLGVQRGDAVVVLLPNGVEFVAAFFAIATLGAIAVPLNSHYQENELTYFIGDCRASMLVTIKEFEALCRCVLAGRGDPCGLILLDEIMDCAPAQEKRSAEEVINIDSGYVQAGDPVIFQYTSGSTGRPKRVSRTHSNLIFELKSLAKTLGLSEQDKFLGVVPFSHVNGLVRSMLASLSVGGTLFPLREFKRQKVISTIQEEGISIFIGVPFMFNILADTDLRRPIDFSSLRLCVSASAPMPAAANRKFRQKYGHYVRQLYGSTETGTISVNMSRDIESSIESVGLPIERVEVAIFRDKGALGNNGEIGEVAVKSAAAMAGYDGLSEEEQPFRNGYFLTGDLGRIDHDGHLYLVGRKKFFINKGGYKINPWELEALLATHSKIKEVVVIGVPTPYGDERVKAVIVPRVACTEEEIIEYCKGRIADFKVPSLIEFRRSLPKSSVGKVLRRKLE